MGSALSKTPTRRRILPQSRVLAFSVKFVGCMTGIVFLLVMVQGNGLAGYLKDWRETRIVVELSESAATKLGAAREQLEGQVRKLLTRTRWG